MSDREAVEGRPAISLKEFQDIRDFLFDHTGITLSDIKKDMVRSRLAKRLRAKQLGTYGEYLELVASQGTGGPEHQELINCLTTNKTDFFRESHHFDFVRDKIVPQWIERSRRGGPKSIRVWCSACSTGEEPYTLAMVLRDQLPDREGWNIKVLATDIDTGVLDAAVRGDYGADQLRPIPVDMRRKYFTKQANTTDRFVIRPEIRRMVTFRQLNLVAEQWPFQQRFDAIFCRNVLIYFNPETQHQLVNQFSRHLSKDGYLFLGHSESMSSMSHKFAPVGGTVFRHKVDPKSTTPSLSSANIRQPAPSTETIILGEVRAAKGPKILKTLLGSCVAACVYDPVNGVGGMNHFSLPGQGGDGMNARYGAYAMELLITAVMKQGGDRNRLKAKVFGGAKVIDVESERLNIGAKNAAFIQEFMATEGIPITAKCLGGSSGLVVQFHVDSARAMVRPLADRQLSEVVRDEARYTVDLGHRVNQPDPNAIELF